jgi:hypothetical protein
MDYSSKLSSAQGVDYKEIHRGQYGGGGYSTSLAGAPVGATGVLDDSLRAAARILPLDQSMSAIRGMSDQSGGGRRRRAKSRKALKKTVRAVSKRVKALKSRLVKLMRKTRMRGGAVGPMADYGAPGMLLSPAQEARAMMDMNPEWKLAADPAAFAPKLA